MGMEAVVYNFARPFKRAFSANQNQTAFVAKTPQLAKPSGSGVIDLTNEGILCPSLLKVIPVGVGAANDTYSLRVWGWAKVLGGGDSPNGGTTPNLWIPVRLAELAVTLGAGTGLAGSIVPATELFADTITIVATGEGTMTANTTRDGNIVLYSPASDITAFAVLPILGFDLIEFDSDQTLNTPTVNVLYSAL